MRRVGTPIVRASAVCNSHRLQEFFRQNFARMRIADKICSAHGSCCTRAPGGTHAGNPDHRRELSRKAMEEYMVAPVMIKEHMEVLGSDGVHVGTVDHLEGRDQVKLTKDDPEAGGEHHFIPLAWVDHVDGRVHLKQSGAEAKARWKTH
jgi:hypothetical protein